MKKILPGIAILVTVAMLALSTVSQAEESPSVGAAGSSEAKAPVLETGTGAQAGGAAPGVDSHPSVGTSLTPTVDESQSANLFQRGWDSVASFCAGHLQVGAGVSTYSLRDNSGNGRFLGSIDELQTEDNVFVPVVVAWTFNRYVGLECRYEEYRARTYTDTEDKHSDGVVVLKGPVPYLVGSLPLDVPAGWVSEASPAWMKRIALRGGVGYSLMGSSMETEPWWALGYSSPESYEELGSPSENRNGHYRSFSLSDSYEVVWLLGLSGQVSKRVSLNVIWTRADVDIDSSFSLRGGEETYGVIPFHYDSLGVDLRYMF